MRPEARAGIRELADWIADRDADLALAFLDAVDEVLRNLLEMPEIGAPRTFKNPDLRGVRMWPIPKFPERLIFYRPTEAGIEVIHVLHASRDYRRILGPA